MPRVSVNLSTITMMKSKVVKRIIDILEENQVAPSQIELEITESAFIDGFENRILLFKASSRAGVSDIIRAGKARKLEVKK